MEKFLKSNGFKTRLWVSIMLLAILVPAYYFLNGIIFKIILTLGFVVAIWEFASMVAYSFDNLHDGVSYYVICSIAQASLIIAAISASTTKTALLGTAAIASVSTDIGAYFFGNLLGGRLIKSRPFPAVSPNKTWEGSALGIIIGLVAVYFWTGRTFNYLWMVPVAFVGDILESQLKRWCGVKDSNDNIIRYNLPVLKWVESLLGGRNGHGGFYDRLDSLSLVLAVLFFLPLN